MSRPSTSAPTGGRCWRSRSMHAYPEVLKRAVVMAVPYPLAAAGIIAEPALLHYTFHVWFHQLKELPENIIPGNDFAYIEYLWRLWEPGLDDLDHLASIKRTLAHRRRADRRARGTTARCSTRPRWTRRLRERAVESIGRPDPGEPRSEIYGKERSARCVRRGRTRPFFSNEFRIQSVPEGGQHSIHRSPPAVINELILSWLSSGA